MFNWCKRRVQLFAKIQTNKQTNSACVIIILRKKHIFRRNMPEAWSSFLAFFFIVRLFLYFQLTRWQKSLDMVCNIVYCFLRNINEYTFDVEMCSFAIYCLPKFRNWLNDSFLQRRFYDSLTSVLKVKKKKKKKTQLHKENEKRDC